MIMAAQLELLLVGMTERACIDHEPDLIRPCMLGVLASAIPWGESPSTPNRMTCCCAATESIPEKKRTATRAKDRLSLKQCIFLNSTHRSTTLSSPLSQPRRRIDTFSRLKGPTLPVRQSISSAQKANDALERDECEEDRPCYLPVMSRRYHRDRRSSPLIQHYGQK